MAPDENAPHGYMLDKNTGERRPKKSGRGRPSRASLKGGASPSLEEIKATRPEVSPDDVKPEKGKRNWRADRPPKVREAVPAFRAGPIAKGMNRLYARTAKLVKVMDPEIGAAILAATRKESDDDVTVGEAWEELAKINPRVRGVLLKLIAGGVYGQLLMAHAPIVLAIVMKDGIRERIPMARFAAALLDNDDDGTPGAEPAFDVSTLLGGLTPEDAGQMAAMANQMMAQMAGNGMPRGQGGGAQRHPDVDWAPADPRTIQAIKNGEMGPRP
jgi:hypothetical protein